MLTNYHVMNDDTEPHSNNSLVWILHDDKEKVKCHQNEFMLK